MKKIKLTINGREKEVIADDNMVLLDLLRDDLKLTGAKQSCDRKGQCGACTVIVNKKATLSCLTKVSRLEGAKVITVEGLGTSENPHLLQKAFCLAGAIQCGFCTPGMIMAAKALLDENLNPTDEEIKYALRRNLCRCTGYKKIIEAVQLAASFMRGEINPDDITPKPTDPPRGVSHIRPSAMAKACGTANFTADIDMPGAAEIAMVLSPYAHAEIKGIDFSEAEKVHGWIGGMTAKDIKGTNRIKMAVEDRPLLCEDKVHCLGAPVAIIVAETRAQALEAAEKVKVEYNILPTLSSPEEAMAEGAPRVHPDIPNICFEQPLIKGDIESGWKEATTVVEDHFTTQIVHQAPLEPENSVAFMEGEGEDAELVVIGRSINIHLHKANIQDALGFDSVRYEEAYSGGNFGQKLEISSEGFTAAAALHFNRAVRYTPSLYESMLISSKRHAYDMKFKIGANADGKIVALDMDLVADNGAYNSAGHKFILRALHMLTSAYYVPNIHVASKLVYTNNPYGSAARGAGPPQVHFALESAVEMLAKKCGIDPLEFRRRNSLKTGQTKATGHVVVDVWPFPEQCEDMKPLWERAKKERDAAQNGTVKRGIGLGAAAFGIGFPGDQASSAVEIGEDDIVTIYAAAADPGEGTDSMMTQLAGKVLGLPLDRIRAQLRSTGNTSPAGPASGSRVTLMIGGATVDALQKLRKAMDEAGGKTFKALTDAGKPTRCIGKRNTVDSAPLDPKTGQGPSPETDVMSIQLAEVEVDTTTGEVKIVKMSSTVDSGPIINPNNFTGQMEGGMDMGVGYALREIYVAGETKDWRTLKFPTFKTSFDSEVVTRETPRKEGTLGSTGVGEMAMLSTAPAVINAIEDACGARITELPATPERVLAALKAAGKA